MKNNAIKTKCDDSSDQIHTTGTKCGMSGYLDHYKKLFCPFIYLDLDQLYGKGSIPENILSMQSKCPICNDTIKWVYSLHTFEYYDPHNCTGSCAEPVYGCNSCSNSEYFHCKKNNVSVCLHPALECDGHPQCDDAEDEDLDNCHSRYIEQGILANYATYRCPSIMYPNMITLATVCDRIVECQHNEDEKSCENTSLITIMFAISMFLITVLYSLLELKKRYNYSKNQENFHLKKKISIKTLMKKYSENHKKFSNLGKL